jgi:hypothetical protein
MLSDAMRLIFALLAFVVAFACQAAAIGYDGARHLLNRTGFGATDAEIARYATLERAAGGRSPASRARAARHPSRRRISSTRPSSRITAGAT